MNIYVISDGNILLIKDCKTCKIVFYTLIIHYWSVQKNTVAEQNIYFELNYFKNELYKTRLTLQQILLFMQKIYFKLKKLENEMNETVLLMQMINYELYKSSKAMS